MVGEPAHVDGSNNAVLQEFLINEDLFSHSAHDDPKPVDYVDY